MESTGSDFKELKLIPKEIHVVSRIHEYIVYYNLILMAMFIIIGGAMVRAFGGSFFDFGTPFMVSDFKVTSDVSWLMYVFFAAFDQFVSSVSDEFDLVAGAYGGELSYNQGLFVKTVHFVMYWQRLVFKYMVMRSQITIIVPVILVDLIVFYVMKNSALQIRTGKWMLSHNNRKNINTVYLMFSLLQLVELPMYLILYISTGMTKSDYFRTGAPLEVLGHTVTSDVIIFFIGVFVLLDQTIYGFIRSMIDSWIVTHLQHSDTTHQDMHMSRAAITFVYDVKNAIYWIRLMFSITFLTSRYYFVFLYTAGDLLSLYFTYKKTHKTVHFDKDTTNIILYGTIFMIAEALFIIEILTIAVKVDSTYFEWPHSLIIFEKVITSHSGITLLLILAAFMQLGSTMATHIIGPDFYNYIYAGAESTFLTTYTMGEKLFILEMTRINDWFKFMLLLQFVLSNCFFVLDVAVIDIFFGSIIMSRYVLHKDNKQSAKQIVFDLARDTEEFLINNKISI